MVERRRFTRQPARLAVSYQSDSLALSSIVADVSEGGAFVESSFLDLVGAQVEMEITCFPYRGSVATTGKVVRTVESSGPEGLGGMGVCFDEPSLSTKQMIRGYCTAFGKLPRVALIDDDEDRVRRIGRSIEAAGMRPLWLPPSEVSRFRLIHLDLNAVVLRWPEHATGAAPVVDSLFASDIQLPLILAGDHTHRGGHSAVVSEDAVVWKLLKLMPIPSA